MSAPAAHRARRSWLPPFLGPRPQSQADPAGRDLRAIETVIIVLLGLLLAAASVDDVAHQVRLNKRTSADRVTWRAYAHANIKHLDVRTLEHGTTDFVCRSTTTVAADAAAEIRLCLMVGGPTVDNKRTVDGGYYIPVRAPDRYTYRYGCFGLPAHRSLCGSASAAAANRRAALVLPATLR
jgi:hypothetical protein